MDKIFSLVLLILSLKWFLFSGSPSLLTLSLFVIVDINHTSNVAETSNLTGNRFNKLRTAYFR